MLKFLKMMVAEDVTITEEVQVEVLVAEEVLLQEEKEALLQEKKADLEATEVRLLEKADLAEEARLQEKAVLEAIEIRLLVKEDLEDEVKQELHRHQDEKVILLQEMKELLTERQDGLKVLVMRQGQEDQEKSKF